jgi:hypothetical protein
MLCSQINVSYQQHWHPQINLFCLFPLHNEICILMLSKRHTYNATRHLCTTHLFLHVMMAFETAQTPELGKLKMRTISYELLKTPLFMLLVSASHDSGYLTKLAVIMTGKFRDFIQYLQRNAEKATAASFLTLTYSVFTEIYSSHSKLHNRCSWNGPIKLLRTH